MYNFDEHPTITLGEFLDKFQGYDRAMPLLINFQAEAKVDEDELVFLCEPSVNSEVSCDHTPFVRLTFTDESIDRA